MSSIDAPVVPITEAHAAPRARNNVLTRGRGLEVAVHEHPARNHEQAPEQDHERDVVAARVQQGFGVVGEVQTKNGQPKNGRNKEFSCVGLPKVGRGERNDRNAEQQAGERCDPDQGGNKGRLLHPRKSLSDLELTAPLV